MNNEERIIKYLDDQLSQEEKKLFEKELSESALLKKEFEKFLSIKNKVKSAEDFKLSEDYFNSVVPRFREKLEQQTKIIIYKNLGYAFSLTIVLFLAFIIFNPFNNENVNEVEEFTQSLNQTEKYEILEYLNGNNRIDDYADLSAINTQFDMENIVENTTEKSELISYYDFEIEKLADNISTEEFNQIYNEIFNKKF
jgi:hypothetical protein